MIDVAEEFRQLSHKCQHYPKFGPKLEDYFYEYWLQRQPQILRQYVPIFWTHLYTTAQWNGKRNLQSLLDSLTEKTFAVVQHAKGIFKNRPPANMQIFSAGGEGHIPIPLTYEMPIVQSTIPRTVFAYFAGAITGPPQKRSMIRQKIFEPLYGEKGFVIQESFNRYQYDVSQTMQECIFALCPRGFGKTSFRLYEAMHCGAIPVYIYDKPWLPYTDVLDWCEFSVQCHIDDVHVLSDILHSHSATDIRRKQERLYEVVPQYFTLEATCKHIVRMLHQEGAS